MKPPYEMIACIALGLSIGHEIGAWIYPPRGLNIRIEKLEAAAHDKAVAHYPNAEIRKSFGKRAPRSSSAYLDEELRIVRLERDAAVRELASKTSEAAP